jgi:uncharacterized membrane-anchored protein
MTSLKILSGVFSLAIAKAMGLGFFETIVTGGAGGVAIYNIWYWLGTGRVPLIDFLFDNK